jgi:hypothetical protein
MQRFRFRLVAREPQLICGAKGRASSQRSIDYHSQSGFCVSKFAGRHDFVNAAKHPGRDRAGWNTLCHPLCSHIFRRQKRQKRLNESAVCKGSSSARAPPDASGLPRNEPATGLRQRELLPSESVQPKLHRFASLLWAGLPGLWLHALKKMHRHAMGLDAMGLDAMGLALFDRAPDRRGHAQCPFCAFLVDT